jgi:hypothetical protein
MLTPSCRTRMYLIVVISAINAAPLDTAHRFNLQTSRWAPKPSGCRTQHQCYRMQIIVINAVLLDTDQGPSSVYSAGSISSPPCHPARLPEAPRHRWSLFWSLLPPRTSNNHPPAALGSQPQRLRCRAVGTLKPFRWTHIIVIIAPLGANQSHPA